MPAFVDTNILLYAHDVGAGEKRLRAADLLRQIIAAGDGVLSTQVLMEFFVNARRKPAIALESGVAAQVVAAYASWVIVPTSGQSVLLALRIHRDYGISPWDALIVAAAAEAQCDRLYTEDLQHGQVIEGVTVLNPFLETALQ